MPIRAVLGSLVGLFDAGMAASVVVDGAAEELRRARHLHVATALLGASTIGAGWDLWWRF